MTASASIPPASNPAAALHAFADAEIPARHLADALAIPLVLIESRSFPDGESLVRAAGAARHAFLYRPLNDPASRDPNRRLVEAMLAASALRDLGASRVTLVAPYLAYMRQDVAFRPGEAVSQKVMGRALAQSFDTVVTVDPHLHRTGDLAEVFPGISAIAVSAAPALAAALKADRPSGDTVLIGPDEESKAQVSAVAAALGLEWAAAKKTRRGDRSVSITLPPSLSVRNRSAVIIDDVVSTGMTLMECARLLRGAGAKHVEALAVHAMFPADREPDFRGAGLSRLRCTDSMTHPCATIPLAGVLADALKLVLSEAEGR